MIRKNHVCNLNLDSKNLLGRNDDGWGRVSNFIQGLCQISQRHPNTYASFYSRPAVLMEKLRQVYEGRFSIHPYSMFSIFWKSIMVFVTLAHVSLTSFRACFIFHIRHQLRVDLCDTVILVLNMFCWLDIVVNFHMGYEEKRQDGLFIALTRKSIARNYLRTWFVLDVLSSLPLSYTFLTLRLSYRYIIVALFLPLLKIPRICTILDSLTTLVKMFTKSYIWYGGVRHVVLFWLMAHLCSCIIYVPGVIAKYWLADADAAAAAAGVGASGLRNLFNLTSSATYFAMANVDMELSIRYSRSLFIALSGFYGSGFTLLLTTKPDELLAYTVVVISAAGFMVYNFVFLLKVYLSVYNSTMRYQEIINQVEEYMRLRQLPLDLQKRLREFYYYRFQEGYYNENALLVTLSEELQNEITIHTRHKLVAKVALFNGVPATVVGSVLTCLHREIYMPNDSVLHAGDIGDCMYFIDTGTIAIYSLKGVEVCHLEDGDHFGEVALLMDSKHGVTAVAVEITRLYRLDYSDFRKYIMTDTLLYERLTTLATKRMHDIVLLDDEFRRQREKLQETSSSEH